MVKQIKAAKQRRTRISIAEGEVEAALALLNKASNEHGVSPADGLAPSANALLVRQTGIAPGRATYLLGLLKKDGAIASIEHSTRVKVVRDHLKPKDDPKEAPVSPEEHPSVEVPSEPTPARKGYSVTELRAMYEATIRRLKHQVEQLEAELSEYRSQAAPSDDILEIIGALADTQ